MKLSHLVQSQSGITKLFNIDLPVKYSFRLSMILDDVQIYMGKLQKFRTDFLTKHGKSIDGKGKFEIKREFAKEFDEGLEDIGEEEINIKPPEIPLSLLIESPILLTAIEIKTLEKSGFILNDISTIED